MKLEERQIHHVCEKILRGLKEKDLIVFKSEESVVLKRLIAEFEKNLKEEDLIETQVKKLLHEHESEVKGSEMNYSKLFNMMKNKIARDRGFIL